MIGAARYYPVRYFAPRYWPKSGAALGDVLAVRVGATPVYATRTANVPAYRVSVGSGPSE